METLLAAVKKYWGYDTLLPLQAEAMQAVLHQRDSLVVLPTGGGKSLCFQAPALCMPGLAVVVSPLIALMKDQVDALSSNGAPAACVNSMMSHDERRRVADDVRMGRIKLLYLSPERLMTPKTLEFLRQTGPSFFAIDEAHCISDWGHDFRPEYRALKVLKEQFAGVAVHAYTATATPRVRDDMVKLLALENPEVHVGSFDRQNLVYRIARRTDRMQQIADVIARHNDESGIVYCIRRADVDDVCASLKAAGVSALPYHAGLSDDDRRANQDAFIREHVKIIVATVAFGMGIDKSNVRFVIHAGAPKSLEHYQQESGRAGRDGLEAECCLLYSPGDFMAWRKLQAKESGGEAAHRMLAGIERFCTSAVCRRRSLMEHFGQSYEGENCGACDACLGEVEYVEEAESLVLAQKILSCVLRLRESYGAGYTALVLAGSREQRILDAGHDQLSTHGLLSEHDRGDVRNWIEQLIEQEFLKRAGEDRYQVLNVTTSGRELLRGGANPRLLKPAERSAKRSKADTISWEGVDRGLFEELRAFRRQQAEEQGLPPFVVFSDATLRDVARRRPATLSGVGGVRGIGEQKLQQYGEALLQIVLDYCHRNDVTTDVESTAPTETTTIAATSVSDAKLRAYEMFLEGKGVEEVAEKVGRALSTTRGYLADCIDAHGISDADPWVEPATFQRIRGAVAEVGMERLKPLHEALGGDVGYDELRIAVACLRNLPTAASD
ncbi:MAG: DNA helicase RecQ [Pirellulaceae bacterium]